MKTRKWSLPAGARSPGGTTVTPGNTSSVDSGCREAGTQPALALLGVRADVLADEDRGGIGVEREPDGLTDDVPAAHDEGATARLQGRVEIAERVEQKPEPVRRPECGEHHVVQDEEWHDPLGPLDGGGEGRVVVQAQITGEQHDHGPVFAHLDKG